MLTTRKSWLSDLSWLAVFLCVFYFLFLGSHALITPDEGRYGEIAREMFVTHDYISPRLNGSLFFDKPILMYWLTAGVLKLAGVHEWSLRLASALLGIFGCLFIYIAGRVLFDRRTAWLSAIILATSPLYFFNAHYLNMDLAVAVFIECALLSFLMAVEKLTGSAQRNVFWLAYLFAGLGVLTKGLIGLVLPMLVVGLWILILNSWRSLLKIRLVSGVIIFLATVLPWYALIQLKHPQFFQFFFVTQQFTRYLATNFNAPQPLWFYLPVVFILFIPWAFYLFPALLMFGKNCWLNKKQSRIHLFLLLWIAGILIFFSIPHSKIITYIDPIFPALALVTAHYLSLKWDQHNFTLIKIILFICSLLATIMLLVLPELSLSFIPALPKVFFYSFACLAVLAALTSLYLIVRPHYLRILISLSVFNIVLLLLVLNFVPALQLFSAKPMAEKLKSYLKINDRVATYHNYYTDLPVYLQRQVVVVADWDNPHIFQRDNWQRELAFGLQWEPDLRKQWFINEDSFWHQWYSDKPWYVLVKPEDFPDFIKAAHYKINMLAYDNSLILISNKSF